jgi:hypothetical protein
VTPSTLANRNFELNPNLQYPYSLMPVKGSLLGNSGNERPEALAFNTSFSLQPKDQSHEPHLAAACPRTSQEIASFV